MSHLTAAAKSSSASTRKGFTLVELLVVIAIIGVLVSLLLPAVQAARESARRSSCSNNMKQMALGTIEYEDSFKTLPFGNLGGAAFTAGFSTHARILPYIDQDNVYQMIDFRVAWNTVNNDPARLITVPVFICPSDRNRLPPTLGGRNNYYGNCGTTVLAGAKPTNVADVNYNIPENNGVFQRDKINKLADVLDGTSHTAMFSEKTTGDGDNTQIDPKSDTFQPGTHPLDADESYTQCNACNITTTATQGYSNVGAPWIQAYHSTTQYYHHLPPNGRSCMYPPGRISTTANSWHRGGVYSAMCDGSVRYHTDTIDIKVWRGMGTRAGGEAISAK